MLTHTPDSRSHRSGTQNARRRTIGEESKKEALSKFFETTMPGFFRKMEKCAELQGGKSPGPLVGKSLSLADVSLFILVSEYFDNKQGAKEALKGCPRLTAAVDAVAAHPNIVNYLAARPITVV